MKLGQRRHLVAEVSGQAETAAVDVVAVGAVVAVAARRAVDAPRAVVARIGAHLALFHNPNTSIVVC